VFPKGVRAAQKIYEVEGTQMLIRTKKNLFFLGDTTLLSDNIFWHDFFCIISADHETFIFDNFKCLKVKNIFGIPVGGGNDQNRNLKK
jgi:hypothetical protein